MKGEADSRFDGRDRRNQGRRRPPPSTTDVLIVGSGPPGRRRHCSCPHWALTTSWSPNTGGRPTPRGHTSPTSGRWRSSATWASRIRCLPTPPSTRSSGTPCSAPRSPGKRSAASTPGAPDPTGKVDYQLASPCLTVDIPQTYLEPILVRNATTRGTQARFSTEYLAHRQDADGVDVDVLDRLSGHRYTIRAKYLIGADGAR